MSARVAAPAPPLPRLCPEWPGTGVPAGVGAAMSLRAGGASAGPYESLNLGAAVGDDPAAVAANRARWAVAIGARPVWLRQVHGTRVLELTAATPDAPEQPADAAWTRTAGVACTVQVADCLPVLFALADGSAVAAAHAGWRGLAAGVLEATLRALSEGSGARPDGVLAWLGPCIGPRAFEVGGDVVEAFDAALRSHFKPRPRPDGTQRWLADLHGLARARLAEAGVGRVSALDLCTFERAADFYSFRRDRTTGRCAASIWLS